MFEDERYSFSDHLGIVAGLAGWLSERGVAKGDRVAIGMRNYPQWLMAFWATQVLGAVAVPLNVWWTAPELRYALEDSGATFAVLDGERYDRMAADLDELGLPSLVVHPTGPLGSTAWAWDDVYPMLDPSGPLPEVAIDPDDPSTIVYTSGTTGSPKGALGTHRNHVTNIYNVSGERGDRGDDRASGASRRVLALGPGRAAHLPVLPRRWADHRLPDDQLRREAGA